MTNQVEKTQLNNVQIVDNIVWSCGATNIS